MYYPDLTPYVYIPELAETNALNVGWLDRKHDFPKESPSETFLDRLFEYCLEYVNLTRGFHGCVYCGIFALIKLSRNKKTAWLGSAEIRVPGKNGVVYAAPNMIFHYVEQHSYKPPQEFIDAVLARTQ